MANKKKWSTRFIELQERQKKLMSLPRTDERQKEFIKNSREMREIDKQEGYHIYDYEHQNR